MSIDRREEQQFNLRGAEQLYAALNGNDLATLVKIADEMIDVKVAGEGKAGSYKGHKGFGQWITSRGDRKIEVSDVVPVGASHMVVDTGVGADVLEFRDGKIVTLHLHPTMEAAMEAAKSREAASSD